MPLIDRSGQAIADPWIAVDEVAGLPADAPALLPADVYSAHRRTLAGRTAGLGVQLPNDRDVAALADDLDRLDLIALHFPAFKDGRAYSQARLLRARYGFRGQLRATGEVLQDQALFLVRCGFDAFEVDAATAAGWRRALARISVVYQPAADGSDPAPWRRQRRPAAD